MFSKFQTRLFLVLALTAALSCGLLMAFAVRQARAEHAAQATERLLAEARLLAPRAAELMGPKADALRRESLARQAGRDLGVRLTLIAPGGAVLADSEVAAADLPRLENHFGRPEVAQAAAVGAGQAVRHSASIGRDLLYVAVRLDTAGAPAFLRLALPLKQANELSQGYRGGMLAALALALVLALVLSWWLARWLAGPLAGLAQAARRLSAGDFSQPLPRPQGAEEMRELQAAFDRMAGDLREAFAHLEGERARLGAIFEGMQEAVVALDAQGRIGLVNPAARALLALDPAHCVGKPWIEALRHSDLARLLSAPGEAGLVRGEMLLAGVGQPDRHLACTVAPVPGGGRVLVLSDITELKRLLAMRQEFTANVSHELKTPLTAIRGLAETLLDGALKEPRTARQFVRRVHEQALSLQALIHDTLDLARVESKGLAETLEVVDLGKAARQAAKAAAARAKKAGMAIECQVPAGLKAQAAPKALGQVLNNLLDNAIKYAASGRVVRIAATSSAERVELIVADQGPGIPQAAQARLFERFYRVETSRNRQTGGTGLGLALVKHLAENMGGSVALRSIEGEGATFIVRLKPAAADKE